MQFLCSIWKILHLTEYIYTGTAHGARNNYQVCRSVALDILKKVLSFIRHTRGETSVFLDYGEGAAGLAFIKFQFQRRRFRLVLYSLLVGLPLQPFSTDMHHSNTKR